VFCMIGFVSCWRIERAGRTPEAVAVTSPAIETAG